MLFDAFIRSLEVVSDVIEFGPVKAVQINTSFSPEAERDTSRILGNLEKENYMSTKSHTDPFAVIARKRENVKVNSKSENESVLDQEEEDMINKAVAEKGYY